jgi:NHLM bacteriocin system ABC transporter peptidase/ATP-binding protein
VKRAKSPTVLQMEATECGAASLGIVMGHYGRFVPLERLREDCGVSRDGSKASSILGAARRYGFVAKGYSKSVEALEEMKCPLIVHWNFNHFLVVEGIGDKWVQLNDPATGWRKVTRDEFGQAFTGVVLAIEPGEDFEPGGAPPNTLLALARRARGSEDVLLFLFIAGLALIIPGLVLPTMTRVFVDDVLIQGKDDWLRPLLFGLAVAALVRGLLVLIRQRYLLRLYAKLTVSSSAQFFSHLLQLPIQFYLARYAGEISDRVRLNDKLAEVLSGRVAEAALDVVTIVCFSALLFIYHPFLTLVGLGIASVNLIALRLISERRMAESQRLQQEAGKLVGVSMGGLQLIETYKASGTESDFFTKWSGYWAKVHNSAQSLALSTLFMGAVPTLLSALSTAAILVLGAREVMRGELTVGTLVAYQTLFASVLVPIQALVNFGGLVQDLAADVRRIDDVLVHPTITSESPPPALTGGQEKLTGWVELSQVTFGYVRQSPPLIRGLDLRVPPGSRLALVGGSGSGKSTIARLVSGLYQPWEGAITFDGKSRNAVAANVMQASVAMVDQDINLFAGTIRDNLTLWDPTITDADMVQAAKDAHIHDEIVARPGGYDGRVNEGGRNFSGGQRQRLEIARALVRNPTILLLDEATSALDAKTEEIIDHNLRRRGCTCLIVAHRLSTIRDADEIIVLENGEVAQRGTHEELMEAKGVYARLMGAA